MQPPPKKPAAPRNMSPQELGDMITVLYFLYHMREEKLNAMWGSHTMAEAFSAYCRVIGINEAAFLLHEKGMLPKLGENQ